ncbi:MAG: YihY/virulence factor BrkB family protein [Oscillospiraceae bacterium]|nr:YihY/virulence factor BrkB family protein [Oscillospiraceae bacterium]
MDFPKGGMVGKTLALAKRIQQMNIPLHATNAGYFIVLSVFPALVLILSVLRYTRLDAQDLFAMLEGFLPSALLPSAQKLIVSAYSHASGALVSVSAVGALWSASRGIYGILRGLNAIYDVREDRGYLYTRTISVVYTFLLFVMLVLTLALNVFGDGILQMLSDYRWARFWENVVHLRVLLLLLLQTALFSAMFMVFPNRKNSFRSSIPGAVLSSVGWTVFTALFSWYVERFTGYSGIYGSVYAVALSMLWLYCCMSILFYGGGLNRILQEKQDL